MRVLLVFAERRGLPTPHDAPRTTKTTQPTTSSECPSRRKIGKRNHPLDSKMATSRVIDGVTAAPHRQTPTLGPAYSRAPPRSQVQLLVQPMLVPFYRVGTSPRTICLSTRVTRVPVFCLAQKKRQNDNYGYYGQNLGSKIPALRASPGPSQGSPKPTGRKRCAARPRGALSCRSSCMRAAVAGHALSRCPRSRSSR